MKSGTYNGYFKKDMTERQRTGVGIHILKYDFKQKRISEGFGKTLKLFRTMVALVPFAARCQKKITNIKRGTYNEYLQKDMDRKAKNCSWNSYFEIRFQTKTNFGRIWKTLKFV